MKYQKLDGRGRKALMAGLRAMPGFLEEHFAALSLEEASAPGPEGGFSPVEQCWHLADLEQEGFAVRIARLRTEAEPLLPDFDGARLARERGYRSRSVAEGIAAFKRARLANLEAFRALKTGEWERAGIQEGVGAVALCDLPAMMAEHDRAHRVEIDAWRRARD